MVKRPCQSQTIWIETGTHWIVNEGVLLVSQGSELAFWYTSADPVGLLATMAAPHHGVCVLICSTSGNPGYSESKYS